VLDRVQFVVSVQPEVKSMLSYIRKVADVRKDDGASAVEYGLLVAAIAALIVIIVFALGGLVKGIFTDTCSTIKTHATGTNAAASNCTP
jgi:pilus assembly protein Flp/PilA